MYTRIWNHEFAERLLQLEADGWKLPPASIRFDTDPEEQRRLLETGRVRRASAGQAALSLNVKEGDLIQPAGLYASNEDMFAFMIHPDRHVRDGSKYGLMKGFMLWNSEV